MTDLSNAFIFYQKEIMRTNKKKIKDKYNKEYSFSTNIEKESTIVRKNIKSSKTKDVLANVFSLIALIAMVAFMVYLLINSSVIIFKML